MRLSTLYMYKNSAETMTKRMSQSNDVYLRMSAGKTLLKASDDPAAATDAVKHRDALAKLEMYSNVRSAPAALEYRGQYSQRRGNLLTTTLKEKLLRRKRVLTRRRIVGRWGGDQRHPRQSDGFGQ